ncbi:MAG: acetylornithine/N-succinyldiaminopimelate aminotransferase, partial [Gammaproteobacteria bacterium]
NPVVTAVARVALRLAQSPELLANVKTQGDRFRAFFASINQELEIFSEVRGRGLMIGAELVEKYAGKAGELLDRCTEAGVLVLVAGPDVLRLLPPLTITDEETDVAIERLSKALRAWIAA